MGFPGWVSALFVGPGINLNLLNMEEVKTWPVEGRVEIAGALVAPTWTPFDRFRRDSPEQMSVNVGVGPDVTQSGGAR
jgi:hypothetical protein